MKNALKIELDLYDETLSYSSDSLFNLHTQTWSDIWNSGGIEVSDRLELAQAINSSFYYILSSIRVDRPYSLSPGGLASNACNFLFILYNVVFFSFPIIKFWLQCLILILILIMIIN